MNIMKCIIDNVVKYKCKNTEQLGVLVEKSMCDILNIKFNTKRKYESLPSEVTNDINDTIGPVLKRMKLAHVGHLNTTHDFVDKKSNDIVSIKTIMSGNKICPQNIGQCSLKSLNSKMGLDLKSKDDFKTYFIENKVSLLQTYLENCFCCDVTIVYKFDKGCVYIIKKIGALSFSNNYISTSKMLCNWNESNTIYINVDKMRFSLGEIQVHTNRDCMKFRFNIDTIIEMVNRKMIKNLEVDIYNLKTKYNFKVEKDMKKQLCFPSFNYIGSKMKLLDYIRESILDYTGKKSYNEIFGFADICSGTGVVSYDILKGGCKRLLTNDIQHYAYTISSVWSIKDIDVKKMEHIIDELNKDNIDNIVNIDIKAYFIYNNYTEAGDAKRMYLTKSNGYKTDKLRIHIEKLKTDNVINDTEYRLLIKLLLYAVSSVSNIASVYGAYLKTYKETSKRELVLNKGLLDSLVKDTSIHHSSENKSILDLIKDNDLSEYEVVYIDPPYVANRSYHDNYHLLETISRYDYPDIKGKTGLRSVVDTKSKFCSKRDALGEFEQVLSRIKSKYIFISYSSESVVPKDTMISIMKKSGWNDVKCYEKNYQRFKSNKNSNDKQSKHVIEYIFCGKKIVTF